MSARPSATRRWAPVVLLALVSAALLYVLSHRVGGIPPLGTLLDPADGLYRTARQALPPAEATLTLPGLEAPVTVVRDDRGVPHVFAASDHDAIRALGYVTAQDRLFQMDFIARVASGQMAAAFGPSAVDADRFLRSTGMEWGAQRNLDRIRTEGGLEWTMLQAYTEGANAYVRTLDEADLPLEFRLLGYRPLPVTPLHPVRLLQYMAYDLTFYSDDAAYGALRERLSAEDYALLYPRYATGLFVPIIPPSASGPTADTGTAPGARRPRGGAALAGLLAQQERLRGTAAEGFVPGKGSNNWAVTGARSTTGAPALAGDPHLGLSLPAVWYEAHLVTPTMNTYGVTIPGTPLPVMAFNDHVAWALTNTGADQIDHYALELDADGTRYRLDGRWEPLRVAVDTIAVNGGAPVPDTVRFAQWGPVVEGDDGSAVALRWVAHDTSRTLRALWGMNRARSAADVEAALRYWDTPMQNVLYATTEGAVAIRSTGYLPVRGEGTGVGLLDGTTTADAWTGRVPFDALPHAANPAQGYLASANQQPTDSTYAFYLGHDWFDGYRSMRIDTLLQRKALHSPDDLARYQSDVVAVQRDVFVPLVDTLAGLSPAADSLRRLFGAWDGRTTVDRSEPLPFALFLSTLRDLAWDEEAFADVPDPEDAQLLRLLTERPRSRWLDVQATAEREDGAALLRAALEATADSVAATYGDDPAGWRWGDHHQVVFRHLTQSDALAALGRGPVAFPGFEDTLTPGGSRPTTHTASWRVVVDFSGPVPAGRGVYPGGQSGNPFSPLYDLHLPVYLASQYYDLSRPRTPDEMVAPHVLSRTTFEPTGER